MMNVGIILWAANATGDETLRHIALEHCRTTQRHLVRPDGGTAHEGIFDVATGRFLREGTHQGYAPDSTWTRGLAWAIYGFTAVHRLTKNSPLHVGEGSDVSDDFLDTARRCAECYLRRCNPSGQGEGSLIPPWDFDAPGGGPEDSSAAAIAASGLWDLSEEIPDDRHRYQDASRSILTTLCSDKYLARSRPGWEGILRHGVYHYHKGLGVDESVAWGDHFFVEALVKALAGRADAAW